MSLKNIREALLNNKTVLSADDFDQIDTILQKYENKEDAPAISFEEELKNIEEANSLKEEGSSYFLKGNYQTACEKYTLAIEKDPKNKLLYSNRAVCYLKLGNKGKGISDAYKSVEIDPFFAKGYYRLGSFFSDSDPSKALEFYQKALEIEPSNSDYKKYVESTKSIIEKKKNSPSGTDFSKMQELFKNPEMMKMAQDFMKNKTPEEIEALKNQFSHFMNDKK
ncbi:TPR repeat-containing protein [Pseudoloma neurophilia]|uniref:TPR repeat-containing protein n=1 Tax=Pseudoloma neurophilia TaxID=146866 RepID=A0A0R0LUW4_9MICR|nr:TPR repeat-containing protein [Pseudoloma neurophilia]